VGQACKINFMMHNWVIFIQMDHVAVGLLGSEIRIKWGMFLLACAMS
jgi:hypothetical protein